MEDQKTLENKIDDQTLVYGIEIKTDKVPYRRLRNFLYWFGGFGTTANKKKVEEKVRRLTKKYGLEEGDIEIYSGPFVSNIPHP